MALLESCEEIETWFKLDKNSVHVTWRRKSILCCCVGSLCGGGCKSVKGLTVVKLNISVGKV